MTLCLKTIFRELAKSFTIENLFNELFSLSLETTGEKIVMSNHMDSRKDREGLRLCRVLQQLDRMYRQMYHQNM